MTEVLHRTLRRQSPRVQALGTGWPMEERVAFHEAGHAVIARVLGLSVKSVSTKREGSTLGRVELESCNRYVLGPILKTELEWRKRDGDELPSAGQMFAPRDKAFYAHLLMTLAGAASEKYFCGGSVYYGARTDNRQIREIMRFFPARRKRLKAMASALVHRHHEDILRLARHLVAPRTISGAELEEVICGVTEY